MDHDVTHYVENRLNDLEARIKVLEEPGSDKVHGKPDEESDDTAEMEVGEEESEAEVEPVVAASSTRRGRRTYAGTVSPTVEEPSSLEGETL